MRKDQAFSLMREYCDHAQGVLCDPVVTELMDRWPEDGSERKAMRWLGFMQGVFYQAGVFTLDELKRHSRNGSIDDVV